MIITCPSCSTRYKLDPAQFGPEGRRVRCTNCSHVWTQMPADDLPKPVSLEPAQNEEAPRMSGPSPAMRARLEASRQMAEASRKRGRAGWIVLIVIVAAVLAAGALARDAVVRAWPPAGRLYAAIGLTPDRPGAGLAIKVLAHNRDMEGKTAVLIIKGEVTNTSQIVRDVPRLRATLRNKGGAVLKSRTFATAQARLLPGETAPFVTRIENPSSEAAALNIDFSSGSSGGN